MIKIYSRFDRPESDGITFTLPTMTQQQFADECDINNIVRSAVKTGNTQIFTPDQRAVYLDCSYSGDYQSAVEFINTVDDDFYSQPAKLRDAFDNNPDKYAQFVLNPANFDKAVEMGLFEKPEGFDDRVPKPASQSQPASPPAGTTEPTPAPQPPASAPTQSGTVPS